MKHFKYVILGSGVGAGFAIKEFVAQGGDPKQLAIVTTDPFQPYDRPPLSKSFLAGDLSREDIAILPDGFLKQHGITYWKGTEVTGIDFTKRQCTCSPKKRLAFEKLLIATGAAPRRLKLPGANLKGIHYLRSLHDSQKLREMIQPGRHAVVVGAGFIGMEVAAVLISRHVETHLLFPQGKVMHNLFTDRMASWFESFYRKKGVHLYPETKVRSFEGKGKVNRVALQDGRELPVDFVVAGVGAEPRLDLFRYSQLKLKDGILVNSFLETNVAEVWAAGDVVRFPDALTGEWTRIEHWDNAAEQGRVAIRNMLGRPEPFIRVPYFFSDFFDLGYEFWGDPSKADKVVHRGKVESGCFSVWWLKNNTVTAAFVMNAPEEEREVAPKWILHRRKVDSKDLANGRKSLRKMDVERPLKPTANFLFSKPS